MTLKQREKGEMEMKGMRETALNYLGIETIITFLLYANLYK